MHAHKIDTLLATMKGKLFQYGARIHCVLDYSLDVAKKKCTIRTNLETYERNFENMHQFLQHWKPNETNIHLEFEVADYNTLWAFLKEENTMSNEWLSAIDNTMKKIQASKDFIPQTTDLLVHLNTMIQMVHQRIQMMEEFQHYLTRNQKMT